MSRKDIWQQALEELGVPAEYAAPAAQFLDEETTLAEQGILRERTAEEQRIVSDAYFWYEATEHDRRNGWNSKPSN